MNVNSFAHNISIWIAVRGDPYMADVNISVKLAGTENMIIWDGHHMQPSSIADDNWNNIYLSVLSSFLESTNNPFANFLFATLVASVPSTVVWMFPC